MYETKLHGVEFSAYGAQKVLHFEQIWGFQAKDAQSGMVFESLGSSKQPAHRVLTQLSSALWHWANYPNIPWSAWSKGLSSVMELLCCIWGRTWSPEQRVRTRAGPESLELVHTLCSWWLAHLSCTGVFLFLGLPHPVGLRSVEPTKGLLAGTSGCS